MSDSTEIFAAMKAANNQRKEERRAVNLEALQKLGIPAREQSKNVFRVDTEWGAVMYYPGTNCWQHKGKTCRGDVYKFHAWLHTQGFLQ